MKIAEVSKKYGISPHTLRYYEKNWFDTKNTKI
ncbi:MerR family DNA-binding transcriptional regulator [Thermotoga profunda]